MVDFELATMLLKELGLELVVVTKIVEDLFSKSEAFDLVVLGLRLSGHSTPKGNIEQLRVEGLSVRVLAGLQVPFLIRSAIRAAA